MTARPFSVQSALAVKVHAATSARSAAGALSIVSAMRMMSSSMRPPVADPFTRPSCSPILPASSSSPLPAHIAVLSPPSPPPRRHAAAGSLVVAYDIEVLEGGTVDPRGHVLDSNTKTPRFFAATVAVDHHHHHRAVSSSSHHWTEATDRRRGDLTLRQLVAITCHHASREYVGWEDRTDVPPPGSDQDVVAMASAFVGCVVDPEGDERSRRTAPLTPSSPSVASRASFLTLIDTLRGMARQDNRRSNRTRKGEEPQNKDERRSTATQWHRWRAWCTEHLPALMQSLFGGGGGATSQPVPDDQPILPEGLTRSTSYPICGARLLDEFAARPLPCAVNTTISGSEARWWLERLEEATQLLDPRREGSGDPKGRVTFLHQHWRPSLTIGSVVPFAEEQQPRDRRRAAAQIIAAMLVGHQEQLASRSIICAATRDMAVDTEEGGTAVSWMVASWHGRRRRLDHAMPPHRKLVNASAATTAQLPDSWTLAIAAIRSGVAVALSTSTSGGGGRGCQEEWASSISVRPPQAVPPGILSNPPCHQTALTRVRLWQLLDAVLFADHHRRHEVTDGRRQKDDPHSPLHASRHRHDDERPVVAVWHNDDSEGEWDVVWSRDDMRTLLFSRGYAPTTSPSSNMDATLDPMVISLGDVDLMRRVVPDVLQAMLAPLELRIAKLADTWKGSTTSAAAIRPVVAAHVALCVSLASAVAQTYPGWDAWRASPVARQLLSLLGTILLLESKDVRCCDHHRPPLPAASLLAGDVHPHPARAMSSPWVAYHVAVVMGVSSGAADDDSLRRAAPGAEPRSLHSSLLLDGGAAQSQPAASLPEVLATSACLQWTSLAEVNRRAGSMTIPSSSSSSPYAATTLRRRTTLAQGILRNIIPWCGLRHDGNHQAVDLGKQAASTALRELRHCLPTRETTEVEHDGCGAISLPFVATLEALKFLETISVLSTTISTTTPNEATPWRSWTHDILWLSLHFDPFLDHAVRILLLHRESKEGEERVSSNDDDAASPRPQQRVVDDLRIVIERLFPAALEPKSSDDIDHAASTGRSSASPWRRSWPRYADVAALMTLNRTHRSAATVPWHGDEHLVSESPASVTEVAAVQDVSPVRSHVGAVWPSEHHRESSSGAVADWVRALSLSSAVLQRGGKRPHGGRQEVDSFVASVEGKKATSAIEIAYERLRMTATARQVIHRLAEGCWQPHRNERTAASLARRCGVVGASTTKMERAYRRPVPGRPLLGFHEEVDHSRARRPCQAAGGGDDADDERLGPLLRNAEVLSQLLEVALKSSALFGAYRQEGRQPSVAQVRPEDDDAVSPETVVCLLRRTLRCGAWSTALGVHRIVSRCAPELIDGVRVIVEPVVRDVMRTMSEQHRQTELCSQLGIHALHGRWRQAVDVCRSVLLPSPLHHQPSEVAGDGSFPPWEWTHFWHALMYSLMSEGRVQEALQIAQRMHRHLSGRSSRATTTTTTTIPVECHSAAVKPSISPVAQLWREVGTRLPLNHRLLYHHLLVTFDAHTGRSPSSDNSSNAVTPEWANEGAPPVQAWPPLRNAAESTNQVVVHVSEDAGNTARHMLLRLSKRQLVETTTVASGVAKWDPVPRPRVAVVPSILSTSSSLVNGASLLRRAISAYAAEQLWSEALYLASALHAARPAEYPITAPLVEHLQQACVAASSWRAVLTTYSKAVKCVLLAAAVRHRPHDGAMRLLGTTNEAAKSLSPVALRSDAAMVAANPNRPSTHYSGDVTMMVAVLRNRNRGAVVANGTAQTLLPVQSCDDSSRARVGREDAAASAVLLGPPLMCALVVAQYQPQGDLWEKALRLAVRATQAASMAMDVPTAASYPRADPPPLLPSCGVSRQLAPVILAALRLCDDRPLTWPHVALRLAATERCAAPHAGLNEECVRAYVRMGRYADAIQSLRGAIRRGLQPTLVALELTYAACRELRRQLSVAAGNVGEGLNRPQRRREGDGAELLPHHVATFRLLRGLISPPSVCDSPASDIAFFDRVLFSASAVTEGPAAAAFSGSSAFTAECHDTTLADEALMEYFRPSFAAAAAAEEENEDRGDVSTTALSGQPSIQGRRALTTTSVFEEFLALGSAVVDQVQWVKRRTTTQYLVLQALTFVGPPPHAGLHRTM